MYFVTGVCFDMIDRIDLLGVVCGTFWCSASVLFLWSLRSIW